MSDFSVGPRCLVGSLKYRLPGNVDIKDQFLQSGSGCVALNLNFHTHYK